MAYEIRISNGNETNWREGYTRIEDAMSAYEKGIGETVLDASVIGVTSGIAEDGVRVYAITDIDSGTQCHWGDLADVDDWWDDAWDDPARVADDG